jgi:hypothetical protein
LRWLLLFLLAGCGFEKTTAPDLATVTSTDLATVSGLRVFTTSGMFAGNMSDIPGVLSADRHCTVTANLASLGGTWRAWVSDSNVNAPNRVLGKGPWLRLDGKVAFAGRPNDEPSEPLNLDERGTQLEPHARVWTGTESGFTGAQIENCVDWTSVDPVLGGAYGDADSRLGGWTHQESQACNTFAHLYCFEQ